MKLVGLSFDSERGVFIGTVQRGKNNFYQTEISMDDPRMAELNKVVEAHMKQIAEDKREYEEVLDEQAAYCDSLDGPDEGEDVQ